jgi:periplasmic protein TonB
MTGNEILKADLLDILFDQRNKQYGAYAIRKFYNNRLLIALTSAIGFVLVMVFLLAPANTTGTIKGGEMVDVTPIELPRKPVLEKPVQKPAQQAAAPVAQRKLIANIKIETDVKVSELVPDVKSLEEAAIGSKTTAGIVSESPSTPPLDAASGSKTEQATAEENNFKAQESSPEFPGGQAAWTRFLNKYLIAPDDLQTGEKKTVMVRFFVGIDSSITHFEVVQSGGAAFDNEVIRVLQKMPKWKPAMQNGHPVSVTFTQPVTFVGMEE